MKTKASAAPSSSGTSGVDKRVAGGDRSDRGDRDRARDEFEGRYPIRDTLLFPDMGISPYGEAVIEVYPEVPSHVQRIVMHRSIAAKLTLLQILVGDAPRTRLGAGSCEIFLSEVPNWCPARMEITPQAPLRLRVRNMVDLGLRVSGTVIIGVAELPKLESRVPRRGLFGGFDAPRE